MEAMRLGLFQISSLFRKEGAGLKIEEILDKSDRLFAQGQSKEAVGYLESRLTKAEEKNQRSFLLTILNELMGYYRSISSFEKAWEYAGQAIEIVADSSIDDTIAGVTTYLNIANIYRASGDTEKAVDIYLQVEESYKRQGLENDYRLGGLYNNLSVASLELGKKDEAVKYGEAAIDVLKKISGSEDEQATSYGNLAGALLKSEDLDFRQIERYLDKAAGLFESKCQNSPHYCAVLAMKGYVAYLKNSLEESLKLYERAMEETKQHYGENADYKRLIENYNEIKRRLADDTKPR